MFARLRTPLQKPRQKIAQWTLSNWTRLMFVCSSNGVHERTNPLRPIKKIYCKADWAADHDLRFDSIYRLWFTTGRPNMAFYLIDANLITANILAAEPLRCNPPPFNNDIWHVAVSPLTQGGHSSQKHDIASVGSAALYRGWVAAARSRCLVR